MSDAKQPQAIGRPVPSFSLSDLFGTTLDLELALTGKRGAVVVFWSSVCSHCIRYDDYLNDFAGRHPELALLVVASRQQEDGARMRDAVSERRLRFPVMCDTDRLVARAWLVEQTPRAFLIDAARKLRYRGAIDNYKYSDDPEHQPYLESAIEAWLAGKAIEREETASFGCPIQSVYYDMPKPLDD